MSTLPCLSHCDASQRMHVDRMHACRSCLEHTRTLQCFEHVCVLALNVGEAPISSSKCFEPCMHVHGCQLACGQRDPLITRMDKSWNLACHSTVYILHARLYILAFGIERDGPASRQIECKKIEHGEDTCMSGLLEACAHLLIATCMHGWPWSSFECMFRDRDMHACKPLSKRMIFLEGRVPTFRKCMNMSSEMWLHTCKYDKPLQSNSTCMHYYYLSKATKTRFGCRPIYMYINITSPEEEFLRARENQRPAQHASRHAHIMQIDGNETHACTMVWAADVWKSWGVRCPAM